MWEKYFRIADHSVIIRGVNTAGGNSFPIGFTAFERSKIETQLPLYTLETGVSVSSDDITANYTFLFEELDLTCEFIAGNYNYEFRMLPNAEMLNKKPIILKMPRKGSYYITNLMPGEGNVSEFSFLLWIAFGVASASYASVAIHSSVVIYRGKAVLFLGETGTGKSTHTQLWLRTIKDSELLNDDSPIVRIMDDIPNCFGSPWSGKGNCFRNESYPIAAIVRLRQARFNHIELLGKIEAFTALYPSCPPSFSADSELTDHICKTLSILIEKIPVYLLDCLPDKDAAFLSCLTIFGQKDQ
jgi:hypothetical protein